ncbi:MAG: WD40/YVTN/BNR-like repeat-containing protein, partial [Candidatus Dormibacteria bacterium]
MIEHVPAAAGGGRGDWWRAAGEARKPRKSRKASAVVACAMFAALWGPATIGNAALAPPPPLPPQPGLASAGCEPSPQAPNTWDTLIDQSTQAAELVVDPWLGCRMYRATDTHSIERSEDNGKMWQKVFSDDVRAAYVGQDPSCSSLVPSALSRPCAASSPPFTTRFLAAPAPGTLALGEVGNGDAVVMSGDAGGNWHLADTGIEGLPMSYLAYAPSNPSVGYGVAIGDPPQSTATSATGGLPPPSATPTLFRTGDGGRNWSRLALPVLPDIANSNNDAPAQVISVNVDPADPNRVWVLLGQQLTPLILLGSQDGGASWQVVTARKGSATQLLVTRGRGGDLRLYMVGSITGDDGDQIAPHNLHVSRDGGVSWSAVTLPNYSSGVLAADPADQERMMYLAVESTTPSYLASFYTGQGFLNPGGTRRVPAPLINATPGQSSPIVADPSKCYGVCGAPEHILQADRQGRFYLSARVPCPMGSKTCVGWSQSYFRFAPPLLSAAPAALIVPPVTATMNQLGECVVPNADGDSPNSGNLAFDGVNLLYGQAAHYDPTAGGDSSRPGTKPYQEIVYRINPATCAAAAPIVITFNLADLQRVADAEQRDVSMFKHPVVNTMVYDPVLDELWL